MYQHKRVHRLVATHFVKNRWKLPIVKFKDGDRSNIIPSNLEWTDQATELHNPFTDSWNPAKRKLTDEQLADCKESYINGVGIAELCQKYGVSRSAIERNIFDSSPEILKAKKEHRDRKNKENGFKSRIPILQLDMEGNFIQEWPSSIAAAKALGMNQGNISNALNGFIQSTGGFKWVKKSSRFNPLLMQKQK
ncbi:MAG: hypothetical protein ACRCR2_02385 [Fusobacteriaceae bacterium]